MSDQEASGDFLTQSDHTGATLVHLKPSSLQESAWPTIQRQLKEMVSKSPVGMIIDCRSLPLGAAETIAPALYELHALARRRTPRIEFSVVGKPEQCVGAGSAFLMPPRFESLEVATDTLNVRRPGSLAVKFAHGRITDEVLEWDRPRPGFLQSQVSQALLTIVVLGLTGGLVAYSARASFTRPVLPRRMRVSDEDGVRNAIQGTVRYASGKSLIADSNAHVLAWPDHPLEKKFKLSAADLAGEDLPAIPKLVLATVSTDGKYLIRSGQLSQTIARYHFLVISHRNPRGSPPSDDDLRKLAEFFDDPRQLLRDRSYALKDLVVDINVVKDLDFVLATTDEAPATVEPAASESKAADQISR